LLLDPEPAPFGTLIGHMARGNPHWRTAAPGGESLAIFLGAYAYVSPGWYPTKRETGKVVPTWNYVAIHAYGPIRFFDDPTRLLEVVTRLTERHENPRAAPWAVADAPADFIATMLRGIIGFEIPIALLQGKWKMSQNRPRVDRAGVIAGLTEDGREDVAALVAPD
ncbi:MAG: FMN-binding negative transcriptional regulator, partial [Acetobacteraceae bacterium]